jgi:hypothetical protein
LSFSALVRFFAADIAISEERFNFGPIAYLERNWSSPLLHPP